MTRRIGRGGRKGQTHTATPNLRSFDVPPASDVTVTRADGTVVIEPAKKPKETVPARRSKGPMVCGMCGGPITGEQVLFSWGGGSARGKPVHRRCDPKARRERPPRATSKNKYATPPPNRTPGPRQPVGTCPKCGAPPGELCTVRYADGTTAQVKIGHVQRRAAPDA